jgi:hypothetical protein
LGGWLVDACNGVWFLSTLIGVNYMNKQNLQIAAQAGLQQRIDNPNEIWGYREDLQQFAELVRQDEREACAKLCDDVDTPDGWSTASISASIRARGNHGQD